MSKYKGLFTFDVDSHRYLPIEQADGIIDCMNYRPKDPLIKDERIRKAVRAWAEALGLQEVYCASNGYEIYGGIDDWVIQFEGEPFPFADKNKIYTIAELCGEEEAPEPTEPTFIDLDERIKEKEEK